MSYDAALSDSLALVNVVRQAFGHEALTEFPDATRGDPSDCLYYRALSDVGVQSVHGNAMEFASPRIASVVAELWGTEHEGTSVMSPKVIDKVIGAFDSNQVGYKV